MTSSDELKKRREAEALRIRSSLNRQRGEQHAAAKGGETAVAFVEERLCIGCDQCTIVCDDEAIDLYKVAMASPLIKVESNRKARNHTRCLHWMPFVCLGVPNRRHHDD
jgi:NAD-dependent dihydropyrimidine dehydrogenase PreA subunit